MSITIKGIPELQRRLKAVDAVAGRPLLRKIQIDAQANAKLLAPHKTRNLSRSIIRGELTDAYTIIKATAGYAAYVELGTRPHEIRPRNKTWLRFPAKGTPVRLSGAVRSSARGKPGAYAFAKVVHHPGTRPQPFMIPGAKKAIEDNVGAKVIITTWNRAA